MMGEPLDEDDLARQRAEVDQALQFIKESARNLKGIYDSYVEAGFSEKQAFEIARMYQARWLEAGDD